MNENEIIKLLTEYRDSLDSKDREEILMITGSVDSIITDYLHSSEALKHDLAKIRTNIGYLVNTKKDSFIHGITLDNQKILLKKYLNTLINQISKLGIPDNKGNIDNSIKLNISQNQSQEQKQSQKFILEIFIESIKDEINGKQLKELKAIVKEEKVPEKARNKIIDKLKTFGSDICSNILANIITNPNIWQGLI